MAKKAVVTVDQTAQWGDGNIVEKRGSSRWYFDFYYLGERVEISSKLKKTPANKEKARELLDKVMSRIRDNSFRFADVFGYASTEKLELFARLEGTSVTLKPQHVNFGDYVKHWYKTKWEQIDSHTSRTDFKGAINSQILPYFKELTFFQINRGVMRAFAKQLHHLEGAKKGEPLSRQRVANLFLPLRTIWHDACDEYKWEPADPFFEIHKYYPKRTTNDEFEIIGEVDLAPISNDRDPLRFSEFQGILGNLDPWYQPIAEIMVLTGMIASEMAGLTHLHLKDGFIMIRRSVSRGVEKIGGKTMFRRRDVRITPAIQQRLDVLLERTEGRRLATSKTGKFLTSTGFYKEWVKAIAAAGVRYRVPYVTRHTFAAWSLIIDIEPLRLHKLMGHGSKKMVYEVYGIYVERLEEDREQIQAFFGEV